MLAPKLSVQINAGRLFHEILTPHAGIANTKHVSLNPFNPIPVNQDQLSAIVIAIGDAENRTTLDSPDEDVSDPYIDDTYARNGLNCDGQDCERILQIYWNQEWIIEYWAVECHACINPIERVLEYADLGTRMLAKNNRVQSYYLELLSQDKPQRFTEGELSAAVLTQTWQTRHLLDT